ncbi:MAG: zinc-binding dehydrogenase [Pseudomonadales bacterium]
MPLQLRSEVNPNNTLTLSLADVPMPEPAADEVVIRIEAAPINPSDLGLLLGSADMSTCALSGTDERPVINAEIATASMPALKARLGESLPVGNEGAGVVVAAGSSEQAQALIGKVVGVAGGAMYSQYRALKAAQCLVMADDVTPAQAASSFVNPLTALAMTETMRMEGHTALVHTAAASNLGQMLNKICLADGIELVNIVRKPEQEAILRELGAKTVVNSSSESFQSDLVDALVATGATLAFDAIGGGTLAGDILSAMEKAANLTATEYSRYGSTVHKQVYIYGGLSRAPSTLNRNFGMAWGIGGWLLTPFLQKAGIEKMIAMRTRVAKEINTTFKSHYSEEISLAEALQLESISRYSLQATGEKFLINPNK